MSSKTLSSHQLVIKDAARQLFGRIISALFGFVITKIISSYLWPLRYGDYGTIFRFFAWWTALVDFWIYVIALKRLGTIKEGEKKADAESTQETLSTTYHKFIGMRVMMITIIYTLAITTAYLIPAYTNNLFIVRGLPIAMLYSASNMFVGIQQLPLQLFWKMNKVSRSLIIARCSQLVVLLPSVFLLFKDIDFQSEGPATPTMVMAFCLTVFSVTASSIGQNIEIHQRSKSLLPFKIDIDFSFIKNIFQNNRKYGASYFFSSFHTLIVLMFLGRFFPTAKGFEYVGYWALALSLIEILLIIPSSLGNSLLHKIPNYSLENKQKSFGNLMLLIIRIVMVIAINFCVFNNEIIRLVSSKDFLGTRESIADRGANQILPFLAIVLALSFIKQVFNYLFVAVEKQNVLFRNNLIGVAVGVMVGLVVIPRRNLWGGVVTQLLIELFFTGGAIGIAYKNQILPKLPKKATGQITGIICIAIIAGYLIKQYALQGLSILHFLIFAFLLNAFLLLASLKTIKNVAKGLTTD